MRRASTLANSTSGFVELHGCRLYYEAAGQGPTLVLVHAGICDSRMWDDQWSTLARNYRVIRFDMPGYGQSSMPTQAFALHEPLFELLRFLHIQKTSLLGLSLGGQVVLDFTLAHPEMVEALIVVATVLTDRPPSDALIQQWSRIREALEAGDATRANEIELAMWVDGPHRSVDGIDPVMRARVRDMNAVKFAQRPPSAQPSPLEPPAAERLGDVQAPTLVVAGDLDYSEVLESARRLGEGIPGARHLVMAGTAHLPNMEQPEEFSRIVLAFLENAGSAV